jgi:hypothetical protein
MHELPCLYDTSFPDTDPFEPQAGGCCSIWPYRFGDVIELPITLAQDHTVFEILRRPGIETWVDKGRWLIEQRGLITLITHPDYLLSEERLSRYDAFLAWLTSQPDGWIAPPRDVAEWWLVREGLRCETDAENAAQIVGPGGEHAAVLWARQVDGAVKFSTDPPH